MEENKGLMVKITKKDKIYSSIILCLVCAIIVLAIVLPRPYKVLEVEKPIEIPVYQKVYETRQAFILAPIYASETDDIVDADGNVYFMEYSSIALDTGNLKNIKVTLAIDNAGVKQEKTITLENNLTSLICTKLDSHDLGMEIVIDANIMESVFNIFSNNVGADKIEILDHYLFEIEFDNALINIIVSYLSE